MVETERTPSQVKQSWTASLLPAPNFLLRAEGPSGSGSSPGSGFMLRNDGSCRFGRVWRMHTCEHVVAQQVPIYTTQ